jgi:hypothetical protein
MARSWNDKVIMLSASPLFIEESPENDWRKRLEGVALTVSNCSINWEKTKQWSSKRMRSWIWIVGDFQQNIEVVTVGITSKVSFVCQLSTVGALWQNTGYYKLEWPLRCSGSFSAEHRGHYDLEWSLRCHFPLGLLQWELFHSGSFWARDRDNYNLKWPLMPRLSLSLLQWEIFSRRLRFLQFGKPLICCSSLEIPQWKLYSETEIIKFEMNSHTSLICAGDRRYHPY